MTKNNYKTNSIKLLIAVFLLFSVVVPIIILFFNMTKVNIGEIITSQKFITSTLNSLLVATVATIFSVCLAFILAWSLVRSNMRFKGIFCVLFTFPMLIPSISHGMGLVILLGSNGVLTNLFHFTGNIYGFWGIIIGSVMYSFPVAFLMLYDVLAYEDCTSYEAADVLGISKFKQFISITLPYLRKPLISVIFATFTLIVTDYGVPLMIGGKFTTLPVYMYQEVIGLLNFSTGSVIGATLMIPAIIAFIIDIKNKDKASSSFIVKAFNITKNKLRDFFAYAINIFTVLCVLLPIGAFVFLTFVKKYPSDMSLTFENIKRTLNMSGGRYIVNSIIIAILVSIVGTILAYVIAYLTSRVKSKSSTALHLVAITSLAIPGIVLGLSYAMSFKGTFLYRTLAILVIVNIIHFLASPYLLAYNSFNKLNSNLEAVGSTLGISRVKMIKDVFIPQMKSTIMEMFSFFFVNSMVTISAVSFLATVKDMPVSLMITQFEAQMMLEASAFVSLVILIINVIVKGIVYLWKRQLNIKASM